MIVERRKIATPEQREHAIALVQQGATLREAAAAVGVSHESVRTWAKDVEWSRRPRSFRPPEPVVQTERKPVYVNGVRLGRLALWT